MSLSSPLWLGNLAFGAGKRNWTLAREWEKGYVCCWCCSSEVWFLISDMVHVLPNSKPSLGTRKDSPWTWLVLAVTSSWHTQPFPPDNPRQRLTSKANSLAKAKVPEAREEQAIPQKSAGSCSSSRVRWPEIPALSVLVELCSKSCLQSCFVTLWGCSTLIKT